MTNHGTFIWNELYTHDPKKACDFYALLLGWRFEDMPMPDGVYRIAKQGDRRVASVFEMKHFEGVPSHWLAYIAVDDIDKRVAAAKQAGAQLMRKPFDVDGVGRIAILKDAVGAPIAWMTPIATNECGHAIVITTLGSEEFDRASFITARAPSLAQARMR
jgi:predicted enzyme related to lactoylglutathione lyase